MKMNNYVLSAIAALGVLGMRAPAGIIATENFGGDLTPGSYGPGQLTQNSGSGAWSATWYVGGFDIVSGNLSHALSPVSANGNTLGIGNARRNFTSTSNNSVAYSFLSKGGRLFDINHNTQLPLNINYFTDANGYLDGQVTYYTANSEGDTGVFDMPYGITASETVMTGVEISGSTAKIWFLPSTATAYDPADPDIVITDLLSQNYNRIVTVSFDAQNYPSRLDGVAIGNSISDVVAAVTPTPGAASALIGAGMFAMGSRRRVR